MRNIRAYVVEPCRIELVETEIPKLTSTQVLLKTISIGMCHTDLPTFLGTSGRSVSKHGLQRIGVDPPVFPAALGHEPVAEVVEIGKDVKNFRVGEIVGGFGGQFNEYFVIDDTTRTFCEIPKDGGKPVKYCCAEPLGCIVNIVKQASCKYGESIAVIGCGFMGLMTIAGLRKSAAKRLVAIDMLDNKLELAKKYGATHTINPKEGDMDDLAYELTEGKMFDVVVEITGSLRGLETAGKIIRSTQREGMMSFDGTYVGPGKILIPSVYSKEEVFPKSLAFNLMTRTPVLLSTHPTFDPRPRENMQEGIASYFDGRLPVDEFVTHEFAFEDIQKAFEMLAHPDPSYVKGIVTF